MNPNLGSYETLIEEFSQRKIDAAEFEERYLSLFKADSTDWKDDEFEILDGLFGAVDAFCPDPNLREEEDLDENQLREVCRTALFELRNLDD